MPFNFSKMIAVTVFTAALMSGSLTVQAQTPSSVPQNTAAAEGDMKAVTIGSAQAGDKFEYTLYNMSYTSKGIIGQSLKDEHNKDIAEIRDIILDKGGRAQMIVISDGYSFGLNGKMIALEYSKVIKSAENSEVILPVDVKQFTGLVPFAYPSDAPPPPGTAVNVMPKDDISLRDLMKASVVDEHNKKIASIDNIVLNKGRTKTLILSFDKIIGVGEEQVALSYDETKLNRDQNDMISFEFSPEQAVSFASYKKALSK